MFNRLKLLVSLVLLPASLCGQSLCSVQNTLLNPGEKLDYQLYYNVSFVWIQAGTCEFTVRNAVYNKKPAFQLMAQGKTQRSFDPFYKVRDTLMSYVDTQEVTPFRAMKYAHEDNWHGIDDFTFRDLGDKWEVTTRLKRKNTWKPTDVSISEACGFDLLTCIYRIRCAAGPELFKPGKKMNIPVRLDDGEYVIHLTYLKREKIKLYGGGYYWAHAFTLSMVEGTVFKRGDVLKMWISDDKNHIPLLIESPIRVGNVKAVFRNGANTRYPLTKPVSK